ncbi:type II toxin-antitoxin system VapC family toxin [Nesterenkonia aurantiaca]|uniref:type II toxin-antitoxin system VapC family toxin n=1 Tax=Nesterenkonia aurantiaca TaxID=1436010 RepID=UPI003EE4ACD7
MPKYVVDSSCLISYLTDECPDRVRRVRAILEDAEEGLCELIVPTVAELEVLGKTPQKLSNGVQGERRIKLAEARAWFLSRPFLVAELDAWTVHAAHNLMDSHSLAGIDAAIVATAVVWKAERVFTFDDQMLNVRDHIDGLEVMFPPEPSTLDLAWSPAP